MTNNEHGKHDLRCVDNNQLLLGVLCQYNGNSVHRHLLTAVDCGYQKKTQILWFNEEPMETSEYATKLRLNYADYDACRQHVGTVPCSGLQQVRQTSPSSKLAFHCINHQQPLLTAQPSTG